MTDAELIARNNMVRGGSDALNRVLALVKVMMDTGDITEKGALSLAELAKSILEELNEQHRVNCELTGVDS